MHSRFTRELVAKILVYHIVASTSLFRFEAHAGLFRLLMKGIFDAYVKFGYSEKATKFEKIFHLKFDVT